MNALEWDLHEMDCRLAMGMLMEPNSVDSIVCDPPYGLSKEPDMIEVLTHWLAGDDYTHGSNGFMGRSWDSFVPGPSVWREAYRVLKPGGHLIAFFGTRTYDMGVLALRLAGFEVRDQLAWVFGSGFPKSHDIAKSIDKSAGFAAPKAGGLVSENGSLSAGNYERSDKGDPVTDEAREWQGWGTALKPAYEPIVLCRKPLSEPTVAANVLRWGTGALNIDGTRVGLTDGDDPRLGGKGSWTTSKEQSGDTVSLPRGTVSSSPLGRWPANLATDGSAEATAGFPVSKEGSAARYFYCAKASKSDRNEGLDDLPVGPSAASQFRPNHTEGAANGEDGNPYGRWSPVRNFHNTVKPTKLMEWLVRMVTPSGGTVLDPFAGSGTTGVACAHAGFRFIGCEMTPEYVPIIRGRVNHAYVKAAAALPRAFGLTMPSRVGSYGPTYI